MTERIHKKSNWSSTTPQNQDSAMKLRRFTTKDDKDEEIQQSPEINLSKFALPKNSPFPDGNIQRLETEGEKEDETPGAQLKSTEEENEEETPGAQLKSDTPTAEEPEEEIQAKSDEPKQEDDEVVQTKLTLGEPGDKYEQEADTVAAKVVEQINSPKSEQPVQGKVEPVVRPTVMRQGGAGGGTVNRDVEQNIQQARGGGQGLAENVREPMEQAFGADFGGVRVHTGGQADVLNRSLNARAFTTGQDIFFKQGEYNPGSRGGQELLAHELTHVVQQGGVKANLTSHEAENKYEQEADTFPLKASFPIQTSASRTVIMLEPLVQEPEHPILEEPRLGNSLRKPTSFLPPLTLKNSSVDLKLPLQFQMEFLEQKSKLPQLFWHSLPKKSPSDPFITILSRWLTKKLGREDISMIAAQIGAVCLNSDKKKTRIMVEKAMISAGEKGLKYLLTLVLKQLVGSPNKQQKSKSGFMQDEDLPKPKFFINLPPINF